VIALPALLELRVNQRRPATPFTGSVADIFEVSDVFQTDIPWLEQQLRISRIRGAQQLEIRIGGVTTQVVDIGDLISVEPEKKWLLEHDINRLNIEVALATRFLRQSAALARFWLQAYQEETSNSFVHYRNGKLWLRPAIIESLFSGGFIGIGATTRAESQLLIFDVKGLSFESPLFGKVWPHFQWDKNLGLGAIISMMSLLVALGSCHPPKTPNTVIKIKIVNKTAPLPAKSVLKSGCEVYKETLQLGGIKEIQHALFLAGFDPGPADGKDGPQTSKAAKKFCDQAGIKFAGLGDPKFINALAIRLGNRFFYIADQP
jgi:hypothetical protein